MRRAPGPALRGQRGQLQPAGLEGITLEELRPVRRPTVRQQQPDLKPSEKQLMLEAALEVA